MTQSNDRLIALDTFRGATMGLMILVNTPGTWAHVYAPLRHAKWHGCTLTDLVFPFFLFIIGISMRYSFEKYEFCKWSEQAFKIRKRGRPTKRIKVISNPCDAQY